MHLATWNLNNRVGKVRFRPDAAAAAIALDADVLVFTEFYPQAQAEQFRSTLSEAGWGHQLLSAQPPVVANRILIVSRLPLEPLALSVPEFDHQFPANIAGAHLPSVGVSVVGVRVPSYTSKEAPLLVAAWEWIERCAAALKDKPAVIAGDLNVAVTSGRSRSGEAFRRILDSGWHRAQPTDGATFFGHGGRQSEIDHILATEQCELTEAESVRSIGQFSYCGTQGAISDHAVLRCRVALQSQ